MTLDPPQGTGWHSVAYCPEDHCNPPPDSSPHRPTPHHPTTRAFKQEEGFLRTPVMILVLTIVVIIATIVILGCILKK